MRLEALLAARADVWRGATVSPAMPAGPSTGCADLDRALPWGGWPAASLTEVLTAQPGAGLSLLLPVLIALAAQPRWLVLVDPPVIPYAPALAARGLALSRLVLVRAGREAPWAMEQALRAGAASLVIGWEPPQPRAAAAVWSMSRLRRLQLAAAEGDAMAVLVRPPAVAAQPSPAVLRLAVCASAQGLDCQLLKLRGGRAGGRVLVAGSG